MRLGIYQDYINIGNMDTKKVRSLRLETHFI